MDAREEGELPVVKLSDGEELFPSLEAIAARHGIQDGAVLWRIGMLQDFEIGFFTPHGYEREAFADRHELVALHGSLAMRADPRLHLHVAVARRDHSVVGGHLFRARVCVTNEICVARFRDVRMTRVMNPATGLKELAFEP